LPPRQRLGAPREARREDVRGRRCAAHARGLRGSRAAWALALALVGPALAAPAVHALTETDPAASAQTASAAPGMPGLPTWRNLYDWPAGHGHVGWNEVTTAPDRADYGFARGTVDGPGLWVWPAGQDRSYTPPTVAEWRYQAPGTTRALSVAVELDYAPRLLSNHCVNLVLRDAAGATRATTGFCNTPADHTSDARPTTHVSLSDPDPSAPLAKQVAIGFSVKCDKPNPSDCTRVISNADSLKDGVHVHRVDMTLVDDDRPVPAPAGEWFANRYDNGESPRTLTMAASDAGAGVTRVAAEEIGVGELDHADAACDPTHHTPALDTRICPPSFSAQTTIDARALAEGRHTYRETARDVAGNDGASPPWAVVVDRTPPVVTLGGTLFDQRATAFAANESRTLTVAATDGVLGGTDAQQRSGVQSIVVLVDGEIVSGGQNAPSPVHDSQPLSFSWTVSGDPSIGDPGDGAADPGIDDTEPASPTTDPSPDDPDPDDDVTAVDGDATVTLDNDPHSIAVLATDWLGHVAVASFSIGPAYTDDQD
jgi:hypothetical protein